MTVRHRQPAKGVIILSLYHLPSGTRETYAFERITEVAGQADGQLTIVEPGRVRTRPLP